MIALPDTFPPSPGTQLDHEAFFHAVPAAADQYGAYRSNDPYSGDFLHPQTWAEPVHSFGLSSYLTDAVDTTGQKRFPYYSSKPNRHAAAELNEKAYFRGHDGDENGLIVCRHLAMAWLLQVAATTGKPDYEKIGSVDATTRNIPLAIEAAYRNVLAASNDVHLSPPEDWGRFAAARLRELERSGADRSLMLLQTRPHALAAEFKIKRKPGHAPQYMQKLYDPNCTTVHKWSCTDDIDGLQPDSIKDLLPDDDAYEEYFSEHESVFLAVHIPEGGTNLLAALDRDGDSGLFMLQDGGLPIWIWRSATWCSRASWTPTCTQNCWRGAPRMELPRSASRCRRGLRRPQVRSCNASPTRDSMRNCMQAATARGCQNSVAAFQQALASFRR